MRVPLKRILFEKRRLVVPLVGGLLVNALIFAFAVYPLTIRARGAENREATALIQLAGAERDQAAARAALDGKRRTDAALETFYREVLPANLAGARQITYLHLAQLAQKEGLRAGRRSTEPESDRDSTLGRLRVSMVLQGDYEDVRRFIYDLESASEFFVIEDVGLVEGSEPNAPLMVTLTVATYYRAGAHAT
jgi:Tfp pilus assembly protein PilO